ncbi:cytochrome o ubiquinol oxidase subunit I [Acidiferrobacter sp. SPIII_3]|jgi:cytochrome o ubiquinol oxidase subunit 1|uniref:cbb3-type cytochrome c oxidase subunit I n=1 Tax=Acidiferrobacter sp. SPIII_3 TaxID=1281578 RepID=UPI000D73B167|nr:cbb3-type cytochrome c oxidase subunit I [Acidiferrobacter sp. SPIII_3]AWP22865.1 cytochrome o ubiquinol oxidase subunit I [Acidiferrobacter sp. SPIII_3]
MLVHYPGPWSPLLGRLALKQIPFQNPILVWTFALVACATLVILGAITYYRSWGYLWREWLTTVDHKKIGVMYCLLGLVMFFRGFIDGVMMRTQQVMAVGPHSPGYLGALHGYLPPYHFGQIYSAHGTIMILFAITPILIGLMNIVVPLQIGARDMAYPYLNAVSFWLTAAATGLVMISLFIGDFSHAGWVGLSPLTELAYSPGVGVDYWIWAVQIGSVGTTLASINIIMTIVKLRAPGMTWTRMPIFCWSALSTSVVGLSSFPVFTAAVALLSLDRYAGTHFFTPGLGGNLMLYTDLFWIWGHPEVYYVVLPAFGIISEIVPTFSEKPLFGYMTMAAASIAIGGVSWSVWLHHFFTMGAGPGVNSFFSIASMLVGIPTGVKVFNWAFTLYRGRIRFDLPMLWALAALVLLLTGGLTGMMLAMPAINYTVHNSVFVVAHFHNMLNVVGFAAIGGINFWFPKVFGFKLDERIGKRAFWFFSAGTVVLFGSMYALGFMGMPRRIDYIPFVSWRPLLISEEVGIFLFLIAAYYMFKQMYVSIRDRAQHRVTGPDAWRTARSLEWLTHCPVPFYNFALLPYINSRDEWAWRRQNGLVNLRPDHYEDIHLPNNTFVPILLGALAFGLGFGMVWRMYWLAGLSLLGIVAAVIARSFEGDSGHTIPGARIRELEEGFPEDPDRAAPAADVVGGVVAFQASMAPRSPVQGP